MGWRMNFPIFVSIVCLVAASYAAFFGWDIFALFALGNVFLWLAVGYLQNVFKQMLADYFHLKG